MRITDYLIDQTGKDWTVILTDWCPPLPTSFTVWLVNRFGDVFAVFEDGTVNMLDIGQGTLSRVADDREGFADKVDVDDNSEEWLMTSLADECVKAGLNLSENQCYSYKTPPILGGSYSVDNIFPLDLARHYSCLADIFRQTRDLPDGSRVEVVVINVPKESRDSGG
jgi:hypothetical protein